MGCGSSKPNSSNGKYVAPKDTKPTVRPDHRTPPRSSPQQVALNSKNGTQENNAVVAFSADDTNETSRPRPPPILTNSPISPIPTSPAVVGRDEGDRSRGMSGSGCNIGLRRRPSDASSVSTSSRSSRDSSFDGGVGSAGRGCPKSEAAEESRRNNMVEEEMKSFPDVMERIQQMVCDAIRKRGNASAEERKQSNTTLSHSSSVGNTREDELSPEKIGRMQKWLRYDPPFDPVPVITKARAALTHDTKR
eukprot:PhF_6_TR8673/c0_g1_i2/m.13568